MTLIKSISGIRGTIGGKAGENLTPSDIVKFATAFVLFLRNTEADNTTDTANTAANNIANKAANKTLNNTPTDTANTTTNTKLKIVVGRDARISGPMVEQLILGTLCGMGVDCVLLGLSTTPSVELSVVEHKADGGIIITASHNPTEWNALKLLNGRGEFLNAEEGAEVVKLSEKTDNHKFATVHELGVIIKDTKSIKKHIEKVLALPEVDCNAIAAANFKVVVDPINSTGAIAIPELLKALGVKEIHTINSRPNGKFAHNPEPLKENLVQLSQKVKQLKADVGIAVDPDVDRLAFMCEDGNLYGEEYTLVTVADYILSLRKGATVSNLSSSQALKDLTLEAGANYEAAAVGEVNVVAKMKENNAVIGGEGNGGIIYPPLHYGRDALVGTALFLTHWAKLRKHKEYKTLSGLKKRFPQYEIAKHKIALKAGMDVDGILKKVLKKFEKEQICTVDGVKISFLAKKEWVHLRKSNTEPIIRIYAESKTTEKAELLANEMANVIASIK